MQAYSNLLYESLLGPAVNHQPGYRREDREVVGRGNIIFSSKKKMVGNMSPKFYFLIFGNRIVELKRLSYRICFVSPELHRPPIGDHLIYQNKLLEFKSIIGNNDLICTKYYQ